MKWLIVAALMTTVPASGFAQPSSNIPSPDPAQPAAASSSALTPPSPTGPPHMCDQSLYPQSALDAGERGKVGLHFQIGKNGVPKNIVVSSTSNFPDLDQAAIACVSAWKYNPALRNGVPIEMDWNADVDWVLPARAHSCRGFYPMELAIRGDEGTSTLSFVIQKDGWPTDIHVTESSGRFRFDHAAEECARHWHYLPATQDGQPIAVPWVAKIKFRLRPSSERPPAKPIETVVVLPE